MAKQEDVQGNRGAILAAATELFARRGFGGVAIQDIADLAGVHKTTVLYQFGTKDALHEAVLEHALEPLVSLTDNFLEGEFSRERLGWHLDQLQRHLNEHPAVPRLMMREFLEGGEYGSAYLERSVKPVYEPAIRRLEKVQDESDDRLVGFDPAFFVHDVYVQILSYFCHGAFLQRLTGKDPFTVDALIARRNYLVEQNLALQRRRRPGSAADTGKASAAGREPA